MVNQTRASYDSFTLRKGVRRNLTVIRSYFKTGFYNDRLQVNCAQQNTMKTADENAI